jgi:aspartyl-tRNA synthetase
MKRVRGNETGKTENTVHDTNLTNSIRKLVMQFTEAVQVKEEGKLTYRFVWWSLRICTPNPYVNSDRRA